VQLLSGQAASHEDHSHPIGQGSFFDPGATLALGARASDDLFGCTRVLICCIPTFGVLTDVLFSQCFFLSSELLEQWLPVLRLVSAASAIDPSTVRGATPLLTDLLS
jgi:hypothetical protein